MAERQDVGIIQARLMELLENIAPVAHIHGDDVVSMFAARSYEFSLRHEGRCLFVILLQWTHRH